VGSLGLGTFLASEPVRYGLILNRQGTAPGVEGGVTYGTIDQVQRWEILGRGTTCFTLERRQTHYCFRNSYRNPAPQPEGVLPLESGTAVFFKSIGAQVTELITGERRADSWPWINTDQALPLAREDAALGRIGNSFVVAGAFYLFLCVALGHIAGLILRRWIA
jgi:hypothetical protein